MSSAANRSREFESDEVTVGTSFATIHTSQERPHDEGDTQVGLELENSGATATDGFKIQIKYHESGAWHDYLADTDFDSTSLAHIMWAASETGPHELGAGAVAFARLNLGPVFRWRAQAKVASGSTTAVLRGVERSV